MQEIFLGVDVAKDWLDIHHPGRSARRIENSPAAVRAFAVTSAKDGAWVVFEASGGYDRLLREALEAQASASAASIPRQARDFAKAMGVIGKTDRVDARMLAELGARLRPSATEPLCRTTRAASAGDPPPPARRMRKQEATRLQQTADGESRADIRSLIALLDRRIAKVEARMADLVTADPELAEIDRRLQTVPGVGPIVAATLIAELPELGQLDRGRSPHSPASLRSLAIAANVAGRRIIGGGRPIVRTMLYHRRAPRLAPRCSPQGIPTPPRGAGKPVKAAITATARKLARRSSTPCSPTTPTTATSRQPDYSCRQTRRGSMALRDRHLQQPNHPVLLSGM